MRRRERRPAQTNEDIDVSMTPMIDVVFQLLIYFLVTFSTSDVLAHLDVSRPAPNAAQSKQTPPGDMIRIAVMPKGYGINGKDVELDELEMLLDKLAKVSTEQTVLVTCDDRSLHGRLIQVLDRCAESGLTKISVMSGR